jgi:hypothetical protein
MFITEIARQIFRDMRQHKLRSSLAIFGIVWGTVAVVLLLAFFKLFVRLSRN